MLVATPDDNRVGATRDVNTIIKIKNKKKPKIITILPVYLFNLFHSILTQRSHIILQFAEFECAISNISILYVRI